VSQSAGPNVSSLDLRVFGLVDPANIYGLSRRAIESGVKLGVIEISRRLQ
jgi:hypothetical protein